MKLHTASIALACALLTSTSTTVKTNPIKLMSSAIKIIDGNFLGWKEFALMVTVRKDIASILRGIPVNGVKVGRYILDGTAHTLKQLVDLEEECKSNNDQAKLAELNTVFKEVKKDLQTNLNQYIALAQGAKGSMLILINESCKKHCGEHGRKHSILHNWGATKDGQEEQQMEKDLTSLTVCSQFCVDLINFLEDMLYSCEKAHEQFKKEMERQASNKS